MSLTDVINAALDKLHYTARTETVIGEPITAGNVTLIPVSKVSIGFAAGGAGKEGSGGSGTGTGGGINIIPMAFISITDNKVQVHSVSKSDQSLNKLLSMAPDLIKKISEFTGRKEEKKKKREEKKEK